MPAELAKRVTCACIHEISFFRDFMGLKSHKFSWSLLARHLYTRQLACEPQKGSVACLSVAVTNGTKKRPVLSVEGLHPEKCRLLLLLLLCLYATQTMLKIHGSLTLIYIGGGGGSKFAPQAVFFATAQKRLALDCLNFVAFFVSLLHIIWYTF